jgi:hypothetical protein
MTCSCGDKSQVEASNREEATAKLKATMDETAIADHMAEKHMGEPIPSIYEVHQMIEETTVVEE